MTGSARMESLLEAGSGKVMAESGAVALGMPDTICFDVTH
jgi:hypothetical protein